MLEKGLSMFRRRSARAEITEEAIEHLPVGLAVVNGSGIIVAANARWRKTVQGTDLEWLAPGAELLLLWSEDRLRQLLATAVVRGRADAIELVTNHRQSPEYRFVLARMAEGQPRGALALVERPSRSSAGWLDAMLQRTGVALSGDSVPALHEIVSDGLVVTSMEGQILAANAAAEHLLGVVGAPLNSRTWSDFVPGWRAKLQPGAHAVAAAASPKIAPASPADITRERHDFIDDISFPEAAGAGSFTFRAAKAPGGRTPDSSALERTAPSVPPPASMRFELDQPGGGRFRCDANAYGIRDHAGRTISYLWHLRAGGSFPDHAADMLAAHELQMLGRLAVGMSHGFNNLLTVIRGHSELLDNVTQADVIHRETVHRHSNAIRLAADRAAAINRQLLSLARATPDGFPGDRIRESFDLVEMVRSTHAVVRELIGDRIELELELPSGPVRMFANRPQIEQAMMNLILNARDAARPSNQDQRGTVRIRLEAPSAARSAAPTVAGASAPETGRGVAAKLPSDRPGPLASLAVSFARPKSGAEEGGWQDDPDRNGRDQAVRIGLFAALHAVHANGGDVQIETDGSGVDTFRLVLPCLEAAPSEIPGAHSNPDEPRVPEEAAGTILLVEDEDEVRELTREFLQLYRYRVYDTGRPEDAIEIAARNASLKLLITDVVMPIMNGAELAARIQAIRPEVKVLYISGYTSDIISRHGISEQGAGFLPKPFTLEELADKVRLILSPPPYLPGSDPGSSPPFESAR
jgi:CheY-like chemotaxis protein/PAS domain-containing protein